MCVCVCVCANVCVCTSVYYNILETELVIYFLPLIILSDLVVGAYESQSVILLR